MLREAINRDPKVVFNDVEALKVALAACKDERTRNAIRKAMAELIGDLAVYTDASTPEDKEARERLYRGEWELLGNTVDPTPPWVRWWNAWRQKRKKH